MKKALRRFQFAHIACFKRLQVLRYSLRHEAWYWLSFRFRGAPRADGKTVVVTGANRGIGLELTRQFLEAGAHVVAWIRPTSTRAALEALAAAHPSLSIVSAEISAAIRLEGEIATALGRLGKIDLLINNAGVFGKTAADLSELDFADLDRTFEVNARGPLRLISLLQPWLEKGDGKAFQITSELGSISSLATFQHFAYSVSKAALNMISRLVGNMNPRLTSISIYPGWVKTDMGSDAAPLEAAEVCAAMRKLMLLSDRRLSGQILTYTGRRLPA